MLAPALAIPGLRACFHWEKDVDAGPDDHQRDDHGERPGVDERSDARAAETEEQRGGADGQRDAPVDAAAALVEPGADDAGEKEAEQRGRRRRVDGEPAKERQERDHQHAADADRADEQANERGDRRKEQERAQSVSLSMRSVG